MEPLSGDVLFCTLTSPWFTRDISWDVWTQGGYLTLEKMREMTRLRLVSRCWCAVIDRDFFPLIGFVDGSVCRRLNGHWCAMLSNLRKFDCDWEVAPAESVLRNTTLTDQDMLNFRLLRELQFEEWMSPSILPQFASLTRLTTRFDCKLCDETLRQLTQLRVLHIPGCETVTDCGLSVLTNLTDLDVNQTSTQITDLALAQLTRLEILDMSYTQLSGTVLRDMHLLRDLVIAYDTPNVHETDLLALTTLRRINIFHNVAINPRVLTALPLTELILEEEYMLNQDEFAVLLQLCKLNGISLFTSNIINDAVVISATPVSETVDAKVDNADAPMCLIQ